ncbi:MAG: NAD-dependent epimerase/dehydratase family protein [Saprospiraceae bacterium]
MKVLVTGAAGFIGFHMCEALLVDGYTVHGLDNLNTYYDQSLKFSRLHILGINTDKLVFGNVYVGKEGFTFHYQDLLDADAFNDLVSDLRPEIIIHLAAQAGVRHSIRHPQSFIDSNIQGFFNVLEACRNYPVRHLIYASSSSVYGTNTEIPFKETAQTDHPISLYGATKKAGEVLAHSYVELYKIPATGLRFFTVYGPWGRPDMAYYKFANQIIDGDTIEVYNQGDMSRDFTYVDDIINGIKALIDHPPSLSSVPPHRILNIGRSSPVNLLAFIEILEKYLERKALKKFMPLQQGDIPATWADTYALQNLTGYAPTTDLDEGIRKFVDWYKSYHRIS